MAIDIACYGTSLTWLYYWQPTMVSLMEATGIKVRAYNLGKSAQNSSWGLENIGSVLRVKPHIVLIEFSMNDCLFTLPEANANTVAMLDAVKTVTPADRIFLMTMNPTIGTGPYAATRTTLPSFYQAYRDMAVSEGVGLIDIEPIWETEYQDGDIPDGVHPTFAAARRVTAPVIASAILGAL